MTFDEACLSLYLAPGTLFATRYRVERKIASGGMGDVYEVVHLETNRRRALKVLHQTQLDNEAQRARFRKEARLAAAVESEFIVDVSDAGVDEATQTPFLVMELLRGEDLAEHIEQFGRLQPSETIEILTQVALALDKTHRAQIIHRDLKPENVFLCEREHGPPLIKLLDFGIAKFLASQTQGGQTTDALGTPLYMAPEQFKLDCTPSPATDVYALGLMAFTMLVGTPYWEKEARSAVVSVAFAMKVAQAPHESAVERASRYAKVSLPKAFDTWFFRATAHAPSDRFSSAIDAIAELAKALDLPVPPRLLSTPIAGPAERASKPRSALPSSPAAQERTMVLPQTQPPRTRVGLVVGALVFLFLGALVGYVWLASKTSPTSSVSETPPQASSPAFNVLPAPTTTESSPMAASPHVVPVAPVASEMPADHSTSSPLKSTPKAPTGKTAVDPHATTKEGDRSKHWSND